MWQMLAGQAAMSFIGGMQKNKAANKQAAADRAAQAYANKMRMISSAMNQSVISANEQFAVEESAEQAFNIARNKIRAAGAAEVATAAAGVTGGVAADAILSVSRNAANADNTRRKNLYKELIGFDVQRKQDAFSAKAGMNRQVFKGGSGMAGVLLGVGKDVFGAWAGAGGGSILPGGSTYDPSASALYGGGGVGR